MLRNSSLVEWARNIAAGSPRVCAAYWVSMPCSCLLSLPMYSTMPVNGILQNPIHVADFSSLDLWSCCSFSDLQNAYYIVDFLLNFTEDFTHCKANGEIYSKTYVTHEKSAAENEWSCTAGLGIRSTGATCLFYGTLWGQLYTAIHYIIKNE